RLRALRALEARRRCVGRSSREWPWPGGAARRAGRARCRQARGGAAPVGQRYGRDRQRLRGRARLDGKARQRRLHRARRAGEGEGERSVTAYYTLVVDRWYHVQTQSER